MEDSEHDSEGPGDLSEAALGGFEINVWSDIIYGKVDAKFCSSLYSDTVAFTPELCTMCYCGVVLVYQLDRIKQNPWTLSTGLNQYLYISFACSPYYTVFLIPYHCSSYSLDHEKS